MKTIRIISFIIAIGLTVCLCACASYQKHKPSSSDSNNSSAVSSAVSEPTASVPSHNHGFDPYENMPAEIKGVTVRFATWEDHYTKINYVGEKPMANIYDDIGIKAEYVDIPEAGYVDSIIRMVASGDAPDVFKSGSKNPFPLTLDIAAPINRVSSINLNEPIWDQSMIETATIDGDVYLLNTIGSPWSSCVVLYYNLPIFEENGIKSPAEYYEDGTWTWESFKKCIKDVKAVNPEIQGAMLKRDHYLNSKGFGLLQFNHNSSTFSSGVTNKLFAAHNEYKKMQSDGLLDGESLVSVINGECAMAASTLEVMKFAPIKASEYHDDIGVTYLPSDTEGKNSLVISDHTMFGIVEGAKNPDAAGYFIRYWLDSQNYDLTKHIYNIKEGNFYYENTNHVSGDKFFNFDDAGAKLVNMHSKEDFWSVYNDMHTSGSPATNLTNLLTEVKEAANKKINDRRYTTATKYPDDVIVEQ